MLMMTYSKFIEAKMCCFIPGKVIDEVMRLLRLVNNHTFEQFRAREILQELRDITSMAIEHFDEKIAPNLKRAYQENAKFQLKGTPFALIINAIRGGSSLSDDSLLDARTSSITSAEEDLQALPRPGCSANTSTFLMSKLNVRVKREIKMVQLRHLKLIRAQNVQIAELRSQMAELKRRLDETDAKNCEIMNANQMSAITETSATMVVGASSEHFIRKSNIRPRTATITVKRQLEEVEDSGDTDGKNSQEGHRKRSRQ